MEASLDGKPFVLYLSGQMFAWIKVSPNYVNFSRALVSDPSTTVRKLELTATDGTAFKILSIESQPKPAGKKAVKLSFRSEPAGKASTTQTIICNASPISSASQTFFGDVTIRTDHPKKPVITLKYMGFFAPTSAKAR